MPTVWHLCLVLLFALPSAPAAGLEPEASPEVSAFIAEMAERHGFEPAPLQRLFSGARLRPEIIAAMERPREAAAYHEYRKQFLTEEHLRLGQRYWERHAQALARAEAEYGVAAHIVVAILGVETQYGRNTGDYPVLDALATLAFTYPRRAAFFRRELEEFLLLCRETGLDPSRVRGSYAGAIGPAQFLPSSYRRYAVDFDGDARRDLVANPADIIGSVAHFLRRHGWQPGEPVADATRVEGTQYQWIEKLGPRPLLPIGRLAQYGVIPPDPHDTERRASLIRLEGEDGPRYLLGFQNFYVITRYNRSIRYAMAVVELGEQLRRRRCGAETVCADRKIERTKGASSS